VRLQRRLETHRAHSAPSGPSFKNAESAAENAGCGNDPLRDASTRPSEKNREQGANQKEDNSLNQPSALAMRVNIAG
jgi:hypothetical protein